MSAACTSTAFELDAGSLRLSRTVEGDPYRHLPYSGFGHDKFACGQVVLTIAANGSIIPWFANSFVNHRMASAEYAGPRPLPRASSLWAQGLAEQRLER